MERKFNVGDRVKVVKDELVSCYVGIEGVVVHVWGGDSSMPYVVQFDAPAENDRRDDCFDEDELDYVDSSVAPSPATPAPITTKVIEGVVERTVDNRFAIGGIDLHYELSEGDVVRLHVEVLRKAGESR